MACYWLFTHVKSPPDQVVALKDVALSDMDEQ